MAKRILIVDDAAFMRMMIKDILTKNGYEIAAEAENGTKLRVERYPLDMIFEIAEKSSERCKGVAVDPWGRKLLLSRKKDTEDQGVRTENVYKISAWECCGYACRRSGQRD